MLGFNWAAESDRVQSITLFFPGPFFELKIESGGSMSLVGR